MLAGPSVICRGASEMVPALNAEVIVNCKCAGSMACVHAGSPACVLHGVSIIYKGGLGWVGLESCKRKYFKPSVILDT